MRQKSIIGDYEYGGRISRSVSQMEHYEQNGMNPATTHINPNWLIELRQQ